MSKIYFLIIIFIINLSFYQNLYSFDQDYCVGYLEEVYFSLDPIEEIEIRKQIIKFLNRYKIKTLIVQNLKMNLYEIIVLSFGKD